MKTIYKVLYPVGFEAQEVNDTYSVVLPFVDGKISGAEAGTVSSVNGHTGEVILTASDVKALPDTTVIPTLPSNATSEKDGLMSKTDKAKLDALPVFTFEKVGEA